MVVPENVMFEILVWLPVISLLRFKSVCKSWRALIESSYFISQHHHRQKDDLFIRYLSHWSDTGSFLLHSAAHNFELPCNLHLPPSSSPDSLKLVASCNGLICLSVDKKPRDLSHDRDLALWNPATRRLKALPEPLLRYPLDRTVLVSVSLGFGFDVKTNDYKVVRVILFQEKCTMTKSLAEVYSLRTNSWRIIDIGGNGLLPVEFILFDPQAPYNHNGVYIYCWFATKHDHHNNSSRYSILSFDFRDEVFGTISLPDKCSSVDIIRDYIKCLRLAFVGGNLACILTTGTTVGNGHYHFEVWILNQYSVEESWTRQCMIDTRLSSTSTLSFPLAIGFSQYDKILLLIWDGSLCLFDPLTREIKDLKVRNTSNSLQVAPYKESLISITERRILSRQSL